MDIETRHELDRLRASFEMALEGVRAAAGDDQEMQAWRKVQTAAWELNALIPSP